LIPLSSSSMLLKSIVSLSVTFHATKLQMISSFVRAIISRDLTAGLTRSKVLELPILTLLTLFSGVKHGGKVVKDEEIILEEILSSLSRNNEILTATLAVPICTMLVKLSQNDKAKEDMVPEGLGYLKLAWSEKCLQNAGEESRKSIWRRWAIGMVKAGRAVEINNFELDQPGVE
jgi:hypothetical protein